ncbi:MAG: hypothetical protein AAF487_00955 [Bacteroidota bacterium]
MDKKKGGVLLSVVRDPEQNGRLIPIINLSKQNTTASYCEVAKIEISFRTRGSIV